MWNLDVYRDVWIARDVSDEGRCHLTHVLSHVRRSMQGVKACGHSDLCRHVPMTAIRLSPNSRPVGRKSCDLEGVPREQLRFK